MRGTPAERFWAKVDQQGPVSSTRPDLGPCWLWVAGVNSKGYGIFWDGLRYVTAHRFSYELHHGPLPEGLEPDHLCRVHPCVNPDHMEGVTRSENTRRGDAPKLLRIRASSKTHCPQGHPYDLLNTRYRSDGRRRCRQCDLDYQAQSEHRKSWKAEYNRRPEVRARAAARMRQRRAGPS